LAGVIGCISARRTADTTSRSQAVSRCQPISSLPGAAALG
jgi:hypothetical protein